MKSPPARREAGVTHVVEFTFALTVFLLLLQAFGFTMDFRLGIDQDNQARYTTQARGTMAQLLASPGETDGHADWENYNYASGVVQLREGLTPGLLAEPGVLDADKCRALQRLPYIFLKQALGVDFYLHIAITRLPETTPLVAWGADLATATLASTDERMLLLRDGNRTSPARLTVTVFEGRRPDESIRITEVMYAPPTDGRYYEWVEIYNPNLVAMDLSEWYFADSGDDDQFHVPGGLPVLPARGAGVLVANATIFRNHHPELADFPYLFSIVDARLGDGLDDVDNLTLGDTNPRDNVAYSSAAGGQGNGKSLVREGLTSPFWRQADPTPGIYLED